MAVQVFINGKRDEAEAPIKILALLEQKRIRPEVASISVNRKFLKRDELADVIAQDGDTVEIMIQLAGGSHV